MENLQNIILSFGKKQNVDFSKIKKEEMEEFLEFINNEWDGLICNSRGDSKYAKNPEDVLYLPYDYVVPNGEKFDAMFYWDSYFIILGLKYAGRNELINGIAGNFLYEIANYGKTLKANKAKWSTGSQMPCLSLIIKEAYNIYEDKKWLATAFNFAKKEYNKYWLNEHHLTLTGLSRFYDEGDPKELRTHAEKSLAEASWNMSPRFDENDIHDLLPIDLNCNLYQYEKDFGEFAGLLGKEEEAAEWKEKAAARKEIINDLMWSEREGLFFDYNFKSKEKKKVKSLAPYQSLFVKLADDKQAERMKNNLGLFQTNYGLAACSQGYNFKDRQWNWPMVFAPLQYICYKGLKNYGYAKEAEEIGKQFVGLVYKNWKETGKIWEKYNGEKGDVQVPFDCYANQSGFGWTNAVAEIFIKEICLNADNLKQGAINS